MTEPSKTLKLYLNPGWHVTNPGERTKNDYPNLDVVFQEVNERTVSWPILLPNLMATPLLWIALYGYELLLKLFDSIGFSDSSAVENLSEEYDIPVQTVDKDIHLIVQYQRWFWATAHYLILSSAILGVRSCDDG